MAGQATVGEAVGVGGAEMAECSRNEVCEGGVGVLEEGDATECVLSPRMELAAAQRTGGAPEDVLVGMVPAVWRGGAASGSTGLGLLDELEGSVSLVACGAAYAVAGAELMEKNVWFCIRNSRTWTASWCSSGLVSRDGW